MADQGALIVTRSWKVPAAAGHLRLDAFARRCVPHLSRQVLVRAIGEGLFSVGGKVGKKGTRLSVGDELTFRGPSSWLASSPPANESLDVPIVYEDEAIVVLDKPAGMPTHGFSGRDEATVANFLAAKRPALIGVGKSRWEAGLLHRLDRETSGLVVAAKTAAAYGDLERQFRRRQVAKSYLALVWGNTAGGGTIDFPLTHDPRDQRRMFAVTAAGRPTKQKSWRAITRYRKAAAARGLTLLEIEMATGVTHQIRVHLAALGHALVGDALYGGCTADDFGLKRHFLHAWKLSFAHPAAGGMFSAEAGLPIELRELLSRLGLDS